MLQFSDINSQYYIFASFIKIQRDKIFFKDGKRVCLFTSIFNRIDAEESYIIGQNNAKVIWRSGLVPVTHEKTAGKGCREEIWQ